ncbi:hypothetical protein [Lacticaseibacillus kribbianus]|uniref:hypothetical protein n=1 Tax=Lacticaseibacillus kribbianus TaxID=2926292 RepID=UPI001CD600AD|nr:hypothetical protein [Lacticaseibacillus kribbianus]
MESFDVVRQYSEPMQEQSHQLYMNIIRVADQLKALIQAEPDAADNEFNTQYLHAIYSKHDEGKIGSTYSQLRRQLDNLKDSDDKQQVVRAILGMTNRNVLTIEKELRQQPVSDSLFALNQSDEIALRKIDKLAPVKWSKLHGPAVSKQYREISVASPKTDKVIYAYDVRSL